MTFLKIFNPMRSKPLQAAVAVPASREERISHGTNKKGAKSEEVKKETQQNIVSSKAAKRIPAQNGKGKARLLLRRAWPSEKAARLHVHRQYTFAVATSANKNMVKKAIEEKFGVAVTRVNIVRREGKIKQIGRLTGRQSALKKAIVTLKEGQKIDII